MKNSRLLAGILAASLALPQPGCSNNQAPYTKLKERAAASENEARNLRAAYQGLERDVEQTLSGFKLLEKEDLTLDNFYKILDSRGLMPVYSCRTKFEYRFNEILSKEQRKTLGKIYAFPAYKYSFSEKEREDLEKAASELNKDEIKKYTETCFWVNPENPSDADRTAVLMFKTLDEFFLGPIMP